MRLFFWVGLNLIGLLILAFMYLSKEKRLAEKSRDKTMFQYILLAVMLYILADTGMFLSDMAAFAGVRTVSYIFSVLYYIVNPLPFVVFLIYCDGKIFKSNEKEKQRTVLYLLPYIIYAASVLLTPVTHGLFYITDSNVYVRGAYFWYHLIIPIGYIFAVYPLLLIKGKNKNVLPPKPGVYHIYLFPLPALFMAIIQLLNYGVLLFGIGYVLSVFIIFVHRMISGKDERSLALRSNYLNTILFVTIASIVMAGMFIVIGNETEEISEDYASYNSIGTSRMLETYLNKEIGVLGTTARSRAMVDWFNNEDDDAKRETAFDEMQRMLEMMYSDNVYVVVVGSGNEYRLDSVTAFANFRAFASIDRDNPIDAWVYRLLESPHEYNVDVGEDKGMNRERVWLNYKIYDGDEVVGIICTGMEISPLMEQILLVQNENMQSLAFVIDEHGVILMDSTLLGTGSLLPRGETRTIDKEIINIELLTAINEHLAGIDGYFDELRTESTVIPLYSGVHRYASITPIGTTNWTLVMLYDASSLFGTERLLPLFFIIAGLLIIFAYTSNRLTVIMIFSPLRKLVASIREMRDDAGMNIYGLDRSDEIGLLSNAISDYFVEGHFDALTNIYNRRYMEEQMSAIINTLQRSGGGKLSVLMIDIDFFKRYNDTYGHAEGDKCLITVAKVISGAVTRIGDFAARYGGEEFIIVLPNTDADGAGMLAARVLENLRMMAIPHEHNDAAPYVTVSIGGTTGDTETMRDYGEFIKQADAALYRSKNSGRNRYTRYE